MAHVERAELERPDVVFVERVLIEQALADPDWIEAREIPAEPRIDLGHGDTGVQVCPEPGCQGAAVAVNEGETAVLVQAEHRVCCA
jgi:hypothetical protein